MVQMKWYPAVLTGMVTCAAVIFSNSAQAQFGPVVVQQPAVVWQQPAPVVWKQPAPVVWQQPAPVVVRSAPTVTTPVVVNPVPVVRPPMIKYQRFRQTYFRNRPILGGAVKRSRYIYKPVLF
jgi:hypothetical protein